MVSGDTVSSAQVVGTQWVCAHAHAGKGAGGLNAPGSDMCACFPKLILEANENTMNKSRNSCVRKPLYRFWWCNSVAPSRTRRVWRFWEKNLLLLY